MISILMYGLFALTIVTLLLWLVDQLFLVDHEYLSNRKAGIDTRNKKNILFGFIDKVLPYLLMASVVSLIFMLRQGLNFDFNYLLVPVTLLLTTIVIIDKVYYKDRKMIGKGHERDLISNAYDFYPILALVVIVRSFMFEPFNIPSSSMVPTLYTGDFILVNKYSYGIRLPLINKKIVDVGSPEHGDVAVFRYPKNPKLYYIKRVIGLPGDEIAYQGGELIVNGKKIDTQTVNDFKANESLTQELYPNVPNSQGMVAQDFINKGIEEEEQATYYQEINGKHTHMVRYLQSFSQNEPENGVWKTTVPKGQYFVMGDNRDRSADSRYWGFVPQENLSGKATKIWMHKKPGLSLPSFSRYGSIK